MDVNFVNSVIKGMIEVLSTMAHLEVKAGKSRIKDRDEPVSGKCTTGLMTIISNDATASIALTFSEPVILEVANNMLPQPKNSIDGIVIDLVGELANMVMGVAKRDFDAEGHAFKMTLPTIIVGNEYLIAHKTKAPILVVPFKTRQGDFFIEASYEKAKRPQG